MAAQCCCVNAQALKALYVPKALALVWSRYVTKYHVASSMKVMKYLHPLSQYNGLWLDLA